MRLTGCKAENIIGYHLSSLYDARETQMHQMPQLFLGIAIKQGFHENKSWWTRCGEDSFLAQVIIMHTANHAGNFAVLAWDISRNKRATSELDNMHRRDSPLNE